MTVPSSPGFVPLPGSPWLVMSPVVIRTTGFPASLLTELSGGDSGDFDAELQRESKALARIAELDSFREALAWQNPAALVPFDSLIREAGEAKRNATRRKREYRLQRYVARYCAKTETIGFFGPLGWGRISDEPVHIRQAPRAPLIGERKTFAEPWSVRAVAAALEDVEGITDWLPLRRRTHHSLAGGQLRRPRSDPVALSGLELAVLRLCDGQRPRRRIVGAVSASTGLDRETVDDCVSWLVRRRYLVAGANLPLSPEGLDVLRERIASILDERVARAARERLAPYLDALRALADSGGDPDAVVRAQQKLAAVFHELTGTAAARRGGRMYAGRGVAYEECLRNLSVELGSSFMARIGGALPGILTISQWITWETAAAYTRHFRRAWGHGRPGLDAVWSDVLAAFYGSGPKPIDDVLAGLRVRWSQLVNELHAVSGGWEFDAGAFRAACERLFPSPGPGWPAAALHSPDLQIAAHSADGVATGDYSVVLSEIHLGCSTISGPAFEWSLRGYPLTRLAQARTGKGYLPVFPESWPRNTGRTQPVQPVPGDVRYAFADVEGAPPETISMTDISVAVAGDAVLAILPDGTRVPILEFFGFFLSSVVLDAWKVLTEQPHTPRITAGGLTIVRETWRADVAGEAFARLTGEHEAFLLMQSWRRSLGMPDQVYIKLGGEVKPFHVDFSSPISVLSFLAALRAALRQPAAPGQPTARGQIVVSEALPSPEQAWVVDAEGERYLGEIRMVVLHQEA